MGIGFTEVRQHFKRAQIDLGVRDTVESPRYLWEALLRAGTTEKKRVTGGATASAREKRHGVARAWETVADRWGHRIGNTDKLSHHSLGGMLFAKTDMVPLSAAPRKLLHEHHHPLHCLQGLFVAEPPKTTGPGCTVLCC